VAQDIRQTGYAAYGDLCFEPVVETDGDCYARARVRFREALVSIELIRLAINKLPAGELVYYVKGSGEKNLDRVRIRTPTFANIPPLLVMLPGVYLSDVPVVTLSIDPCISCTER
jgi:ech hydrogenase subunit E